MAKVIVYRFRQFRVLMFNYLMLFKWRQQLVVDAYNIHNLASVIGLQTEKINENLK